MVKQVAWTDWFAISLLQKPALRPSEYWPVKAEVYNLDSLSAHGDYNEMLQWLGKGSLKPGKVYITHGEMVASDVMRKRIRDRFRWDVEVAELFDEVGV